MKITFTDGSDALYSFLSEIIEWDLTCKVKYWPTSEVQARVELEPLYETGIIVYLSNGGADILINGKEISLDCIEEIEIQ